MVEERTDTGFQLWPNTRRGVILLALAVIAAIVVGIIPALWINRSRHTSPTAPAPAVAAPVQPIVTPLPEPTIDPATTAAPAAAATTAPLRTKSNPSRPKLREKRPAASPPSPPQPTCDIYLHPHGCPR